MSQCYVLYKFKKETVYALVCVFSLSRSGFIPPLLMDTPHVRLIKNQLKTPRRQVLRAARAEGKIEALPALSLKHTHSLSRSNALPLPLSPKHTR